MLNVVLPIVAVAGLVLLMVVVPPVRGFRRRPKPQPVLWRPDERPERERLESYAAQKLRELTELGINVRLDYPGQDRKLASRLPDYNRETEVVDRWPKDRRWP